MEVNTEERVPLFNHEEAVEVTRLIKSRLSIGDYVEDLRVVASGMFGEALARTYKQRLDTILGCWAKLQGE